MTHRLNRIVFPLMSFATLVALACTCGNVPASPTAAPLPTTAPPTKPPVELPTEAGPATKPPIGGETPVSGGSIELAGDVYAHPSGAFTTAYPAGWESNERDDGTYFGDPNSLSEMDINFTNVGVEFDEESFTNFVNNMELNWFGGFDDYQEESREPQDDGSLLVLKTLTDRDGNARTVFSYYWQEGTVVFGQDFWSASDEYDAYVDGFVEIANSMETFPDVAASAPLYVFRYNFTCPSELCTFDVPYGWSYLRNEDYDHTIIDQFKTPDGNALIENVTYDDGTPINKSVAGQFALGLLKEFYEVQDIVVTDDQVQSDGSERLTWYSKEGGYSGQSFFETRGTSFLMLTFTANNDYYDLYGGIWTVLLDTYAVP